jgi:FAD synthetase
MTLAQLVSKYIASAEQVLTQIEVFPSQIDLERSMIEQVVKHAKTYLADAKYYREKEKLDVSLASVAYCEGLLDALKLLKAVKFEWPSPKEEERF